MELQFSQAELDTYLSTLDLKNPSINKVLNSIQLLSKNNYTELLYFLVSSRIQIESLFNISINNKSISVLLNSLNTQSNPNNINSKVYYIDFINTLPLFSGFQNLINQNSSIYLARLMSPAENYTIQYSIDPTGLSGDFSSVSILKTKYTTFINSTFQYEEYLKFKTKCEELGFNNILNKLNDEILNYGIITTADRTLPIKTSINSLIGFVLRGLYNDIFRYRYNENFNKLISYMISNQSVDIELNGSKGLLAAQFDYGYDNLKTITDVNTFFNELSFVALIRYVFTNVYGTVVFTPEFINNENNMYDSLVNDTGILTLLELYLSRVLFELKTNGLT